MKLFIGVFRYEYRMSIRRWGLWLAFGVLMALYLSTLLEIPSLSGKIPTQSEILPFAGTSALMLNLFMPVVGGILAADRLVRDQKNGVDELLRSTPLSGWPYLAGKYFAALCSITTPVLLTSLLLGLRYILAGAPLMLLPAVLLSFLGITLPAYAFVIAFSLICPLIIPVRVYQILFTGYWFWGNMLSPNVMPTLNGTYLTPIGYYALYTLFGGIFAGGGPDYIRKLTALDALINWAVLFTCAFLALAAGKLYLTRRARRA